MEIDKTTLKVLSVDTRLDILKRLRVRRMLPSELSKSLGLAPSTVTEHLKKLESAGLVVKKDTGHKWIYYELTDMGSGIVKPEKNVRFALVLSVGAIFIFSSLVRLFQQTTQAAFIRAPEIGGVLGSAKDEAADIATHASIDPLFFTLLVIGVFLVALSVINLRK